MMYKRLAQVEALCVLSVSTDVLNLPDVVISDQNAASDYVRFYPPNDLSVLDFNQIYADDWRHLDNQNCFLEARVCEMCGGIGTPCNTCGK